MMCLRIGMSVLMVLAVSVAAWAEPEVQKASVKAPPYGTKAPVWQAFFSAPPVKLVKAAFLGVGVSSLRSEALRCQLGLPDGVGLVVLGVLKDGPSAKAGIVVHDVLHKLDDQLLVNQEQLAVLVRMHKVGDVVALTVIRSGKSLVLSAKLAEKMQPPLVALPSSWLSSGRQVPSSDAYPIPMYRSIVGQPGVQDGKTGVFDTGGFQLKLTRKGGRKHLVAKKGGEVVFSGFINTDAERKAVPADVKKLLGKFEMYMKAKLPPVQAPDAVQPSADASRRISGSRGISTSKYVLRWTIDRNGVENLLVKEREGNTIFDGPMNTPGLRAELPADVLPLLSRLQSEGPLKPKK